MKTSAVTAAFGITVMPALKSLSAAADSVPKSAVPSLCVTLVGPASIIPDEPRATIAVHAGPLLGISFVSLSTGRLRVPVSRGIRCRPEAEFRA